MPSLEQTQPQELYHDDSLPPLPKNDAQRAEQFCKRWKGEIAYIPDRKLWLCREETGHWREDHYGGLLRRAAKLSEELLIEAEKLPADTSEALRHRQRSIRAALNWGNLSTINPALAIAKSFLSIRRPASDFDADPFVAGTPDGGVLDLRTGQHRPTAPTDLVTQSLGAKYNPAATCPRWDQFLTEVFPDPAVRDYVWKSAGYTLSGDVGEQCFFFLNGLGNNGKSTFLKTIESVFGDYAWRTGSALLAGSSSIGLPPREATRLHGKRLLLSPGIEEGRRLNTGAIKTLTGGDSLSTDRCLVDNPALTNSGLRPACKLWFAGNHKPVIRDNSASIWRRLRVIPMDQFIEEKQRDETLDRTLRKELPGILNWLLAGCLAWQKEGLPKCETLEKEVDTYSGEEDPLGTFLQEGILFTKGAIATHAEVNTCYQAWCQDRGINKPLSGHNLARSLRALRLKEAPRTTRSSLNWQDMKVFYHRNDGTSLLSRSPEPEPAESLSDSSADEDAEDRAPDLSVFQPPMIG